MLGNHRADESALPSPFTLSRFAGEGNSAWHCMTWKQDEALCFALALSKFAALFALALQSGRWEGVRKEETSATRHRIPERSLFHS